MFFLCFPRVFFAFSLRFLCALSSSVFFCVFPCAWWFVFSCGSTVVAVCFSGLFCVCALRFSVRFPCFCAFLVVFPSFLFFRSFSVVACVFCVCLFCVSLCVCFFVLFSFVTVCFLGFLQFFVLVGLDLMVPVQHISTINNYYKGLAQSL